MKILKERGITLVALVITIIVLLILAGVTLSLVLGDSGVVTKADEAKTVSNQKEIEEELKLKVQEYLTANEGVFNRETFIEEIVAADIGYENSGNNTVTKEGVKLSIGTKGNVAISNEVADTYVASPEEWFTTIENQDGTITITGFDENVLTKSEVPGTRGDSKYNWYYGEDQITEMSIPKTINGKEVKSLGNDGYVNRADGPRWCSAGYYKFYGIENIIIPEGIEEIKSGCFTCFNDLVEITIPSTVDVIGAAAFGYAPSGGYGSIQRINVVGKSEIPEGWSRDRYTGNPNWCPSDCEVVWDYSE